MAFTHIQHTNFLVQVLWESREKRRKDGFPRTQRRHRGIWSAQVIVSAHCGDTLY